MEKKKKKKEEKKSNCLVRGLSGMWVVCEVGPVGECPLTGVLIIWRGAGW